MIGWLQSSLDISENAARLIVSGGFIVFLGLLRYALLTIVKRRIDEPSVWYRVRKIASYVVWIVGVIVLASLWVDGGELTTYLAVVSAGLAIALADPIKDLAGWLFIVLRRPFRIGDRVEVDGKIGDIVDIRVFRFSMLEVGHWVDADQSTGRLLHIPNLVVWSSPIANYTEGFEYIWHEIPMLVTFESDWHRAEEIVASALADHADHHEPARAREELRQSMTAYRIKYTHTTPVTYLTVKDSGVLITGRILVEVRKRRSFEDAAWRTILESLAADPTVELAYPTIRAYLKEPIA